MNKMNSKARLTTEKTPKNKKKSAVKTIESNRQKSPMNPCPSEPKFSFNRDFKKIQKPEILDEEKPKSKEAIRKQLGDRYLNLAR